MSDLPSKTRCGKCHGKITLHGDDWEVFDGGAYQQQWCRRCGAPVVACFGCAEFVRDIQEAMRACGSGEPLFVEHRDRAGKLIRPH